MNPYWNEERRSRHIQLLQTKAPIAKVSFHLSLRGWMQAWASQTQSATQSWINSKVTNIIHCRHAGYFILNNVNSTLVACGVASKIFENCKRNESKDKAQLLTKPRSEYATLPACVAKRWTKIKMQSRPKYTSEQKWIWS